MRINKKFLFVFSQITIIALLQGCLFPENADEVITPGLDKQSKSIQNPKRFQQSEQQTQTVVESAVKLSEQYAKLSSKTATLEAKNKILTTENLKLEKQDAELKAQLRQTQKELTEANHLLVEMRIELNNWKTNILGFREEMRNADKTQLETLLKILKILGGEIGSQPSSEENQGSKTASANQTEPNQPKTETTKTPGEPND